MKLLNYYLLIFAPVGLIVLLSKYEIIASNVFVLLLLIYIFVYRTYLDGYKLAKKNILPKKEIWKLIIPGKRLQYVKDLYLS
jgi:hypothetical protein